MIRSLRSKESDSVNGGFRVPGKICRAGPSPQPFQLSLWEPPLRLGYGLVSFTKRVHITEPIRKNL